MDSRKKRKLIAKQIDILIDGLYQIMFQSTFKTLTIY